MKDLSRKKILLYADAVICKDRAERSRRLHLPKKTLETLTDCCLLTPHLREIRALHGKEIAEYRAMLQDWILTPAAAAEFAAFCHDEALLCWLCERDAETAFALLKEAYEALNYAFCQEHQRDRYSSAPDFNSSLINAELHRALYSVTDRPLEAAGSLRILESIAHDALRHEQKCREQDLLRFAEEWVDEDGNLPFH